MGSRYSRFDDGIHETLVLQNGKVSKKKSESKGCYQYHSLYLRVNEITVNKLPDEYRSQEIVEFIKAIASLTVKIVVDHCSKERPKYFSKKDKYPGYEARGKDCQLFGSGRIADVYQDDKIAIKCTCSDCRNSAPGERESWIILVFTASHVVYDTSEAEKAECHVFYDRADGGYKTINLIEKRWSSVFGDLCLLTGATCDRDLAIELTSVIKTRFNPLWLKFRDQYLNRKEGQYKERLVVIVSHPHGWSKRISFSLMEERKNKDIDGEAGWFFTYKAYTCPASSGAPVYVYGQDWFEDEFVHSGSNAGVNYSTTWCPETK